jgi:hypothetical protein
MKKLFFVLLAFAFATAQAQTADDIIQKYANAMGGLDNFKKIKTAKLIGTVSVQENELPITVQIINGKAMRTDVEAMGNDVVNCYKDGAGWKINPFAAEPGATDATAEELNEFKNQSSLANQLMDYKARGYKAELVGQEDVNGSKAYKIKLTTEGNKIDTYYIDSVTYMFIRFVGTRNLMGQDVELQSDFGDIKDVNGLKFSSSTTVKSGGLILTGSSKLNATIEKVHFDKIELDVPVDEKIFNKG